MDETEVLDEAELAALSLVRSWRSQVNSTAGQYVSSQINELLIQELEMLHHAISARQIELTAQAVDAAATRLGGQANAAGLARRVTGAGVALARRRHPITGQRLVHQALVLTQDLPQVLAGMRAGELGETQAAILVRETDGLSSTQRSEVADQVRQRWPVLGDRGLGEAARAAAARIAPDEIAARHSKAIADRHVSFRSAPDAMLRLSALLPLRDGLTCVQALQAAADTAVASPDAAAQPGRWGLSGTRREQWRQAQADALVAGITGHAPGRSPTAVTVNLLIPVDALTANGDAYLQGYGNIPGDLARDLISAHPDVEPQIRRIFTAPDTGDLVSMESRSRTYTGLLREFIRLRDQHCRTPFCESAIRHIDHIRAAARGGPTTASNGDGTCEHCNYTKQLPGNVVTGSAQHTTHTIGLVTAHSYPPAPPGGPAPPPAITLPPQPPRFVHRRRARRPSTARMPVTKAVIHDFMRNLPSYHDTPRRQ
ncbi:uncharacterized protein DUF222 [Branchiibius hedensis]|uniref:HNH nuclease domain-containing protein n=1 Tax=Branchiibius hedensis TaxID=672460 RepID=A0A2Y8ZZZ9_9MICO|nr:HNH endonuclease signature motif containing protein [Branchiibius hedensis]PWJ26686.1 uncharacterized protein DUF222 [Branchiibius hedensis]SSA35497.1 protein of unknown function [Branchiibius hedensis]